MCGNAGSRRRYDRLGRLPFRAGHRARRIGIGCGKTARRRSCHSDPPCRPAGTALSAKLFDRRKTGYLLTEAGQRVADSAEAMESTIVANQEAVGGSRAHLTGTVRIGAPDGFGSHFLASRLVKFAERYPDLDLQLVATARLFSLSKREADIAISLTMPKEGRIVGRKLLDYSLGLYAAPAYLDRAPKITSRERPAAASLRRLHRGTAVHARTRLPAAGLAEDLGEIPQRQSDRAAQRHHRRASASRCCRTSWRAAYPRAASRCCRKRSRSRGRSGC